ncbi:MAG: TetR/AcrR family transcriptional regulator [Mycobacterium sp.]|nr:TetR/AcrR family transcriptional regulator [Mycobacterium sp.]
MHVTPSRRVDAIRTEDRILNNAPAVLRSDQHASMGRIADEIGVHRATLYRHFPNREALIQRLTERAIADGRAIVAAVPLDEPCLDEIRRLATAIAEFGDRYRFLIGSSPVLAAGADPIGLTPLIERWQQAALVRADLPPQWFTLAFTALAIALQDTSTPSPDWLEGTNHADVLFSTFVNGAAVDGRSR